MTESQHRRIADAFRHDESLREAPAGLRDEVVAAVMERSARPAGPPRYLALVAVVLAATLIVTMIGLLRMRDRSTPAGPPPTRVTASPAPTPPATPTAPPVRFTDAHVESARTGQLRGQARVVFTETGLPPGQAISYHITGAVDLLYDCGRGGPSGPAYPVREPVDFTATRTADTEGTVSATIAIPPPAGVPACPSPVVTGDWLNFVVEDTTSGIRAPAGGLNVAT